MMLMKEPEITGRDLCRILKKLGFRLLREHGSHAICRHDDGREVVVPLHEKPLGKGLLESIIKRDLKMKKEEFDMLVEGHEI